ncbi:MAG: SIS domain-containing protein [Selenomonadaceae bacterium]|nr:SIS domain-containing protein [Selenomonadaceae bacterium]
MLKSSTSSKIDELINRYPMLDICRDSLNKSVVAICESFRDGHKLLTCGNGGSASDSMHIVGELMKGFILPRSINDFDSAFYERLSTNYPNDAEYFANNLQCALPAISLVGETALTTAFANDQAPDLAFAQQILGIGNAGDILLAITTSGNSTNVLHAVKVAKLKGLKTIALTGRTGGKVKTLADIAICVPADSAHTIQELHLPVYHMLCLAAENEFFTKQ